MGFFVNILALLGFLSFGRHIISGGKGEALDIMSTGKALTDQAGDDRQSAPIWEASHSECAACRKFQNWLAMMDNARSAWTAWSSILNSSSRATS